MATVQRQRCGDYVANGFHIVIRKSCRSCAHKEFTNAYSKRLCKEHNINVKPSHLCSLWKMSDQLKAVGNAVGRVKRKEYLDYYLSVRVDERMAEQLGLHITPKSIQQIRDEFEKEHGSIYIKH